MTPLTKTIAFLALTFAFVVLYGHGISGFVPGIASEGGELVSGVSNVGGEAVNGVMNYFYPPEPPPPPTVESKLQPMLDRAPSATETEINVRSSTYIPPKQHQPKPHQ